MIEYQEAAQALRAAEQARRGAISVFGAGVVAILGFVYSRELAPDTRAYLGAAAVILSVIFSRLHRHHSEVVELVRPRLLELEREVGASLHGSASPRGWSERKLYALIYLLIGVGFAISTAYYTYDAARCERFILQSCGPYQTSVERECPCGEPDP